MGELDRPDGISNDAWTAIEAAEDRLQRARRSGDLELVVGSAKDLCESVARVVVNERGGVAAGDDVPDLINAAHKALEFQPGDDLANDPETRKIAAGLKTVMFGLNEMRNRYGTGHGRAVRPEIVEEHAELESATAMLWCTWALRRLEPYIAGDVSALIRDLHGETFHRGDLARRLAIANLPRLDEADQGRLGTAVARRSSQGTFVVADDGVEAVRPEEAHRWPRGYVVGLVMGLFFNANGLLDLGDNPSWNVQQAARLVSGLKDGTDVVRELADRVTKGRVSVAVRSDDERRAVLNELRVIAREAATSQASEAWQRIATAISRE